MRPAKEEKRAYLQVMRTPIIKNLLSVNCVLTEPFQILYRNFRTDLDHRSWRHCASKPSLDLKTKCLVNRFA